MTLRCPRCGVGIPAEAHFCRQCGLELSAAPAANAAPAGYPYSPVAGYSVVKALSPPGPPKGVFWVGLALLLGGLGLAVCQLLLTVTLDIGQAGQQSALDLPGALGISGCVMFVIALLGAVLVAAGRPRRPG